MAPPASKRQNHYSLCRRQSLRTTLYAMSERERFVRERETSPLAEALVRVGDRWTLLVVQALLDGPKGSTSASNKSPE